MAKTQISKTVVVTTVKPMAGAAFVTEDELVAILLKVKGAKPISFVAQTVPAMVKKHRETKEPNPFLDTVVKVARVNGMVNFHYDDGVLRRLEKEGKSPEDFKQGESWHQPVLTDSGKLTPLCCHKNDDSRLYVRFMLQNPIEHEYLDIETNQIIADDDLKPYLGKRSEYANQGLISPLRFLVYGVQTIETLTMNKTTYFVRR